MVIERERERERASERERESTKVANKITVVKNMVSRRENESARSTEMQKRFSWKKKTNNETPANARTNRTSKEASKTTTNARRNNYNASKTGNENLRFAMQKRALVTTFWMTTKMTCIPLDCRLIWIVKIWCCATPFDPHRPLPLTPCNGPLAQILAIESKWTQLSFTSRTRKATRSLENGGFVVLTLCVACYVYILHARAGLFRNMNA